MRQFSRAIIHIGTEKTGSSTLQHLLYKNRSQLLQHGYAYPHVPGRTDHRSLAVYAMALEQEDQRIWGLGLLTPEVRQQWNAEFKQRLYQELDELSEGVHTVVFSSEHLHSRLQSKEEIQRVYDLLAPRFETFRVIMYLRPQDEVAVSLYTTEVLSGKSEGWRFPGSLHDQPFYYDYHALQRAWGQVFGSQNLDVRSFHQACARAVSAAVPNAFMVDFLEALKLPTETGGWIIPSVKNQQMSARALHVLRSFNRFFPRYQNRRLNRWNYFFARKLAKILRVVLPGKGIQPDEAERQAFLARFP